MFHDIAIIYEDDLLVAVNKPPGMLTHEDEKATGNTVADWALTHYPGMERVGETMTLPSGRVIERPGIVHRIDRETSGILLLCKTSESYAYFKKQFQQREVKKTYSTFVYGVLAEKKGTIDRPIGRKQKSFHVFSAEANVVGKTREARTEYAVLKERSDSSFLEVYPQTGRTHQIRVHLKAIGHPVVCDGLYAPRRECILGFARLALHARMLTVMLPSGVSLSLEAPFPADFENALAQFS